MLLVGDHVDREKLERVVAQVEHVPRFHFLTFLARWRIEQMAKWTFERASAKKKVHSQSAAK
jgi:hypothetical protein